MRALVLKEFRENLKLAVLGLVIYTLLLAAQYRAYLASPANLSQPLADGALVWSTTWFCCIFGAVLGWLQIHNERRPDLWAFLIHRPLTPTRIFFAKTLAGLGLYVVVVGAPLLGFIAWARWPGHVAAPFQWTMMRPLAAFILTGVAFYFAGMLTGLRQARWYGSRALGLGMALIVCLLMQVRPEWWQGFLLILLGGAILLAGAWSTFQTHGYYRGQPIWGKGAVTLAVMLGCLIVAVLAALLLSTFLPGTGRATPWPYYAMTEDGAIFQVTEGPGRSAQIVDLEGKPLLEAKTGRQIEPAELNRRLAEATTLDVGMDKFNRPQPWTEADLSLAFPWRATSDTLWYYWRTRGRLVGYDLTTRRCIGSLGPNGFASDLSGGGDRFSSPTDTKASRTLSTATALYLVDLEQRTARAVFTTTSDDPILATSEIILNGNDWEYTAVATKRLVRLLTTDGKPVWQVPYQAEHVAYHRLDLYFLQPAGQFALWMTPTHRPSERAASNPRIHVDWLARDHGVVRTTELAALARPRSRPSSAETLVCAVSPPAVWLALPWLKGTTHVMRPPRELLLLSWGGAALVCLPVGWWLARRYHFSLAAQAGWAVFHVLFGLPGLLALLSVQEWPAREACPNCKKLRVVDRRQCEHCGADFAPPEKTGTEVFAPLEAG